MNETIEGSLYLEPITYEYMLAIVNNAKVKVRDIDICLIKLVMPYAGILKYLKHIQQ